MRCYICNRETQNLKKDPDGKLVCICATCRKYIYDCNRTYQDITDEDIQLLKMSKKDFVRESKHASKRPTNRNT